MIASSTLSAGLCCGLHCQYTCETANAPQELLFLNLPPRSCVFPDVRLLVHSAVFDVGSDWSPKQVGNHVLRLVPQAVAWCVRHCRMCQLYRSHGDISGSPCVDWSSAGLGRGVQGFSFLLFLAWACVIRGNRPFMFVHENVRRFPAALLEWALGDLYMILSFETSPDDASYFTTNRYRRYDVGLLKGAVVLVYDVFELWSQLKHELQQAVLVKPGPMHCMMAGDDEVYKTREKLAKRRKLHVWNKNAWA